jgi:DNA-binding response OmpR family regulator
MNEAASPAVILVVEDDAELLEMICSRLHEYNVATLSAASVDAALAQLEAHPEITALWMDHYLFGQDDGLVLASKVRSDNSGRKSLPIFVISNTASENKVQAYINLGIEKYIVKANASLDTIVKDVCGSLHIGTQSTDTIQTSNDASATIQPMKILIIEDELALRKAIVEAFTETKQYTVIEAPDGAEGLKLIMSESPDAVVLDNEMPNLDGVGMLKQLAQQTGGIKPYVLLLTNTSSVSLLADVMQYGVRDYLVKADNPLSNVVDLVTRRMAEGKK